MRAFILDSLAAGFPYFAYGVMIFVLMISAWITLTAADYHRALKTAPANEAVVDHNTVSGKRWLSFAHSYAPMLGLSFTVAGMMLGLSNNGEDLWTVLPAAMGTTLIGAFTVVVCGVGLSIQQWTEELLVKRHVQHRPLHYVNDRRAQHGQ